MKNEYELIFTPNLSLSLSLFIDVVFFHFEVIVENFSYKILYHVTIWFIYKIIYLKKKRENNDY